MKLYDIEEAQKDLVDAGQPEIDIVKKFTSKKTFQDLKYD